MTCLTLSRCFAQDHGFGAVILSILSLGGRPSRNPSL